MIATAATPAAVYSCLSSSRSPSIDTISFTYSLTHSFLGRCKFYRRIECRQQPRRRRQRPTSIYKIHRPEVGHSSILFSFSHARQRSWCFCCCHDVLCAQASRDATTTTRSVDTRTSSHPIISLFLPSEDVCAVYILNVKNLLTDVHVVNLPLRFVYQPSLLYYLYAQVIFVVDHLLDMICLVMIIRLNCCWCIDNNNII